MGAIRAGRVKERREGFDAAATGASAGVLEESGEGMATRSRWHHREASGQAGRVTGWEEEVLLRVGIE